LSWDTLYNSGGGGGITMLIYFVNENLGFTSGCAPFGNGSCGFERTSDGGYTWNGVESLMVVSLSFVDNNTGWGCFEVPDPSVGGFLKKTEDGGESWIEQLYTLAAPEYFGNVYFVNQDKGWITGGSSPDSIMFTTDEGENWNTQSIGSSAELNSIYFVDENIGWAVGNNGVILHTTTGGVVSVEEETNSIPNNFNLKQNYPNPFNPSTKIKYSIPQLSNVAIKVFDILGNEIETLVNEVKQTGTYEITWYAEGLPSGIYFYRLQAVPTGRQAGDYVETKKMVLMK
jgi:hypothetical protein